MKENPKQSCWASHNYPLPDECIAKFLLPVRQVTSRNYWVYRHGEVTEDIFTSLLEYLTKGSSMIFNNTKVSPGALYLRKKQVHWLRWEYFCLELDSAQWLCTEPSLNGTRRSGSYIGNLKKCSDFDTERKWNVKGLLPDSNEGECKRYPAIG